ncbi:MAG: CapA family protein [Thalassospira sp.]|uniref:CapA family protein n=1 Tax=Thalassospira sp. TaxID=1912094 RepID=UPI003A8ABFD7
MSETTILGVGDIILDLDNHGTAFDRVKHILRKGDIVFANCDQTFSDLGSDPNGFWPIYVSAVPHAASMIDCVKDAGFSVLNFGNNHSLDWGYEAVFDCMEGCRDAGMTPIGFGKNIVEARRPTIINKDETKVGFLNYCSIGPAGYEATESRPGHVPLRAHTYYQQWDPQPGTPALTKSFVDREDLSAMIEDIKALRPKVDILICTFHWGVHYIPAEIADYEREAGHAAIDAGADIIFGQHAHLPKGIEVYNGKTIFYGMHNFSSRGEWTCPAYQPGSKYPDSYKWDWTEHGKKFATFYGEIDPDEKRSSMIAKISVDKAKIVRTAFIPCWISDHNEPEAVGAGDARGQQIFEHFKFLSHSQGFDTKLEWDGDEIVVSD